MTQKTASPAPLALFAPAGWCFDPDDSGAPLSVPDGGDSGAAADDGAAAAGAEAGAAAAPAASPAPAPSTLDAINQAIADVSATVAPAKPAEPAPAAPAAAPAASAPAADPNKPADPAKPAGPTDAELTAPLEGLSGRTKARFEQMAHRIKERSTELETVRGELETLRQQAAQLPQAQEAVNTLSELHGAMQEAQVSGEDFAGFLQYAKAVRSGNFTAAAQTLIAQLRPLLPYVHGQVDIAGALEPLADFPDLQAAVANHEITAQHAQELAHGRRIRQQTLQSTQQSQQAQQQREQEGQVKQQALGQLHALEQQLARSDADYGRIAPELVKAIPAITRQYPPHLWATAVRERYDLLKAYLPQQPATQIAAPAAAPQPQPIRPGGVGGGIPAKLSTRSIVDLVTSGELTG